VCMPPGVTVERVREIFMDYFETLPIPSRELGAIVVITLALGAKYPCVGQP
jgi:hypothetical protein